MQCRRRDKLVRRSERLAAASGTQTLTNPSYHLICDLQTASRDLIELLRINTIIRGVSNTLVGGRTCTCLVFFVMGCAAEHAAWTSASTCHQHCTALHTSHLHPCLTLTQQLCPQGVTMDERKRIFAVYARKGLPPRWQRAAHIHEKFNQLVYRWRLAAMLVRLGLVEKLVGWAGPGRGREQWWARAGLTCVKGPSREAVACATPKSRSCDILMPVGRSSCAFLCIRFSTWASAWASAWAASRTHFCACCLLVQCRPHGV